MQIDILQNFILFCKLTYSSSKQAVFFSAPTADKILLKLRNYLTLKFRSEKAEYLGTRHEQQQTYEATHFMKCRRRSVTNLADLTIGLPGSLNVRVLCSMYRTSHINDERRLYMKRGEGEWRGEDNRLHF